MIEYTTWKKLAQRFGSKNRQATIKAMKDKATIRFSQDGIIAIEWINVTSK